MEKKTKENERKGKDRERGKDNILTLGSNWINQKFI